MDIKREIHEAVMYEYAPESGMIHVMEEDLESFIGKFLEAKLNEAYQKGREEAIAEYKEERRLCKPGEHKFIMDSAPVFFCKKCGLGSDEYDFDKQEVL